MHSLAVPRAEATVVGAGCIRDAETRILAVLLETLLLAGVELATRWMQCHRAPLLRLCLWDNVGCCMHTI